MVFNKKAQAEMKAYEAKRFAEIQERKREEREKEAKKKEDVKQ